MLMRWASRWIVVALLSTGATAEDNWPQFRGPGARGVAEDPSLPESWSTTENVAWSVEIPGDGWSSPVVWGDRIFVTSVLSDGEREAPRKGLYFGGERDTPTEVHRWMVYCVDWNTGKFLWKRELHRSIPPQSRHLKNTYASETPVTDGETLFAYFGNTGLFALDMEGQLEWSRKWEVVETRYGWGTAASPVLHRERLYIVNDNESQSFLVALDKTTGEPVWRVDRDEGSNWATPYIWENDLRTEIVTPGTRRIRSYDLNGKLLWELGGMSSITIPTPFSRHGLLYVTSGYVGDDHRPVYAIRPGGSGDIGLAAGETSNRYIAWYEPQAGPYNPSSLVYGDYYYTLYDRGFLAAHEARTGRPVYGKKRIEAGAGAGAFTASPWAYNGLIFCLSEDGVTYVLRAGAEYELLGKNTLDEMSMATPAIVRGSLILRTASKLYRILGTSLAARP
jgi:outer membrane protein assembly factor BamB